MDSLFTVGTVHAYIQKINRPVERKMNVQFSPQSSLFTWPLSGVHSVCSEAALNKCTVLLEYIIYSIVIELVRFLACGDNMGIYTCHSDCFVRGASLMAELNTEHSLWLLILIINHFWIVEWTSKWILPNISWVHVLDVYSPIEHKFAYFQIYLV